jgi:hypothetical protein
VGLLLGAGASAQVVNDTYTIVDRDNGAVFADLEAEGHVFDVRLEPRFIRANDEVVFYSFTNHPDDVKISTNKAKVAQKDKANPVMVQVDLLPGGVLTFSGNLTNCKGSKLDADVDAKKATGKFKLDAKDCDTNLSGANIQFVAATCASTKQIKGSYKASTAEVKSLKIAGKGTATP